MHRALLPFLVLPALAASGCSGGPAVPFDPSTLAQADADETALLDSFGDAKLLFEGFATPEPGGEWRVGDEVLLGVEYRNRDEREHWVIGLRVATLPFGPGNPQLYIDCEGLNGELLPAGEERVQIFIGAEFTLTMTDNAGKEWNFDSDSILITASTYDLSGKRLERENSVVPAAFLAAGFHDSCTRFGEFFSSKAEFTSLPEEEAEPIRRAYAHSFAALLTLFQTLEKNEAMAGILWRIVEKPSVFSVVMRGGVEVSLAGRFEGIAEEPRPSPAVAPGTHLFRLPIEIQVNDRAALHASMVVAPTEPPLRTVAGVVAIDGQHPRDPEKVVRVRLLATRRGPVPKPEPPPENLPEGVIPIPQSTSGG